MLGARIRRPSRQPIESRGQLLEFDRDGDVDVVRDAPTEIEEATESGRSDEHEWRIGLELAQVPQCSDLSRGERHLVGSRCFRYFARTSSPASAPRSDGRLSSSQYVAVTAGWGLDAQGVQNGIDTIRGTKTAVPKAGTVLVFKLRKG